MYRNEFDNLLRKKELFDAYMFYGQSTYLIEYYAELIASTLGSKDDLEKMYFDDYDFKYAKNKLLQSSLFSSNNLLLIKIDKKLNKNDVTAIIEACNKNPDSRVIFACMGDSDFKAMAGYFNPKKNKSVSVRLFAPTQSEAIKLLEMEAVKLGVKCDISSLNHLYFMHRHKLTLCVNDLKKLAILDTPIDSKLVDIHCFGMGNVSLDDFLHKLLNKEDVSEELELLFDEGINEIYLITQITTFVQQLFMINSYARVFGAPNAKEILGFVPPKNVWERKAKIAISIKPQTYLKLLDFLSDLELELKSSKISNPNPYIQAHLRNFSAKIR